MTYCVARDNLTLILVYILDVCNSIIIVKKGAEVQTCYLENQTFNKLKFLIKFNEIIVNL